MILWFIFCQKKKKTKKKVKMTFAHDAHVLSWNTKWEPELSEIKHIAIIEQKDGYLMIPTLPTLRRNSPRMIRRVNKNS